MRERPVPPVWLMGMSYASLGLVGGYVAFVLPQMLAERHVPEPTIATISAIAISPGFFGVFAAPMLDVWRSRRFYATLFWMIAAACTAASTLLLDHLVALTLLATLGYFTNQLAASALGGWLATVCGADRENELAAWLTVANIGGFGVFAVLGGEFIRGLPAPVAAALLAVLIVVPLLIFPFIPSTPPDQRLASESFGRFSLDVLALLRRRNVQVGILMFVLPCATFSLTNMIAGFGADYAASPRVVGLLGGLGSTVAGVIGSLLMPPLARRMPLRTLYLLIGAVGAAFTLLMLPLPRQPESLALLVVGENAFQSCAIACSLAIVLEAVGRDNPLAATNYAVMNAAYNIPISYMLVVDGWGYGRWGLGGALSVDAGLGIAAVALLAAVLARVGRRPAATATG